MAPAAWPETSVGSDLLAFFLVLWALTLTVSFGKVPDEPPWLAASRSS